MKNNTWVRSLSPGKTKELGSWIGKRLGPGSVILLKGPIGGGKTTFVKGLAEGLSSKVRAAQVVSPTFVLIKRYPCRMPFFHIDLYRLKTLSLIDEETLAECFNHESVAVVEWPRRARGLYPKKRLEIEFRHQGPQERLIRSKAVGGFKLRLR